MARDQTRILTLASRPSRLARGQASLVVDAISECWPNLIVRKEEIVTRGDRTLDQPLPEIGGKGLFTEELEAALRRGRVDLAVHSLKDLPVDDPPGLCLGAILQREDARDVLVTRGGETLADLKHGARVGTSSPRRRAQLLALRPDLNVVPIRGNVETRVRRVEEGHYDAAVMAAAGLIRLGLEGVIRDWFSIEQILPAPGQGALAVQCRAGDDAVLEILTPVDAEETCRSVMAERAFLSRLGGGCSLPVGAYASCEGKQIRLLGVIVSADGTWVIRGEQHGADPLQVGDALAAKLSAAGGQEVLQLVET